MFAYDCTGSYDSEGMTTRGFPPSVVDLHAALTSIAGQPDLSELPLILFAHFTLGFWITFDRVGDHWIQLGLCSLSKIYV
ncbi:MAG: hypothetical protein JEY71_12700 [Sphaerochaeta sp.]|nr:hypothetical protein [Sphaerochaeta sp.]